jgi:predicted AlkP superfamily phosphohydrolase/phosphomutase
VPPEACRPRALYDLSIEVLGHPLSFAAFSELRKGPDWEQRAADALLRGIAEKERFALALLERSAPYDFFGLLFGESDTVAHHFWHLADPLSPRHDPILAARFSDLLLQVYQRLDTCLGRLLEADPGFEAVVIASDHGFGGSSDRVLHLNAYLAEHGFLSWRGRGLGAALPRKAASRVPRRILEQIVRRLPDAVVSGLDGYSRYSAIDFAGTSVFSDERDYAPSLWLNLMGREPQGTVAEGVEGATVRAELARRLEACLLDWRDPVDGAPVVRRLIPRDEVFRGPCADRAPDFLLELERPGGYSYNLLPSKPGDLPATRVKRENWRGSKGAGMAGSHREDGIYLLAMPGLEGGEEDLGIAELLPRWLAAQGQRAPLGHPLSSSSWTSTPPSTSAPPPTSGQAALAARLERLGYIQ